ncbi:MAG: hypothetical protein K9H48_14120 [Melioribacteraceae bacterium]|nr:hypothetical protein [Melioribacteraceae bacterium]MCF8395037.1 hypothetical protein [Melioribacteraceae bacterium]
MTTRLFTLLFLICILVSTIPAQNLKPEVEHSKSTFTRNRTLFGYSAVVQKKLKPTFRNIFLNISHRESEFDKFGKSFKLEFAFEYGTNLVFGLDDTYISLLLLPYFKIGPEIRIMKNLFVGGNFGLAASFFSYLAAIPFSGVNTYYLVPLKKNFVIEFEAGFHKSFFIVNSPSAIYISAGIALD